MQEQLDKLIQKIIKTAQTIEEYKVWNRYIARPVPDALVDEYQKSSRALVDFILVNRDKISFDTSKSEE